MSSQVIIAVCTFRRPVMLRNCLEHLVQIQIPFDRSIHIVIIDNAPDQSARDTVESIQKKSPVSISYLHESRRGIPFARNKAVEFALDQKSDYLAFIDDDEYARSDWLTQMLACAEQFNEPIVVHGRVIPECLPDAPKYLLPFFSGRECKPTGTQLKTCATDNVIFSASIIRNHTLVFDESRPLAGGTDTKFFCKVREMGIKIISCAEAIVYETVPLERISITWLSKRKFRVGINVGRRKKREGKSRLYFMIVPLPKIVWKALAALFFLILLQRCQSTREWLIACRYGGMIWGTLGLNKDAYRNVDGY